ncbi:MAG TPA: hypothetical protein VEJ46_00935 [Candidatus Acidoferrum sp.]|nr:hypothetical protein [Candidatus Acidoferrum sp.]
MVLILLISFIIFLVWCRAADRKGGGSESLVVVTRRMVWKHFKLACWMTIGLGIIMWLFGAKSRKENPGLNHPVDSVSQTVATLFAPIALILVIFARYMYDDHRAAFNFGLLAFYLIWLVATTWYVVGKEYEYRSGAMVLRVPVRMEVWGCDPNNPVLQKDVPTDVRCQFEGFSLNERRAAFAAFDEDLPWEEAVLSPVSSAEKFPVYSTARRVLDQERQLPSLEWEFPKAYTHRERLPFQLKAMVPWVLIAALIIFFFTSWRNAPDCCNEWCTANSMALFRLISPR